MTSTAPHAEPADQAGILGRLFVGRSSPTARLAMREQGFQTEGYGLSIREFREHVAGRIRFGPIPFVDREHVGWACVDFDATLQGLDPDSASAFAIVNTILEALAGFGIRAALERSKSKGWHIWIFFEKPVLAAAVRALLRRIALDAGARDEADLVCPRQDRLDEGGSGNGTWMPLFGGDSHRRTRFYTVDPETMQWVVAPDQAAAIEELLRYPTPADAIPPIEGNGADPSSGPTPAPAEHPCAWILHELAEAGLTHARGAGMTRWSVPEGGSFDAETVCRIAAPRLPQQAVEV